MKRELLRSKWVYLPVAAVAAVGAATLSYPGGLLAAYQDFRDTPELRERVEAAERVNADIDARTAVVADRISVKETLVANLIDGRTTLDAVAGQFRQLNADDVSLNVLRTRYGHLPADELAARNVIDYASTRLFGKPTRSAVLAHLDRQYTARFGHRAGPQ